jgi:TonB family protein
MADWKDDIEKYRRGELTSAEMHALEKKALQDPFLADALEGAESISAENFSADLNELQQSIDFQSEEKKVASFEIARAASAPMAMKMAAKEAALSDEPNNDEFRAINKWAWPLRIAASVVIIFGAFWVGKQLIPQGGEENLALKKEEAKPQSTTPAPESVNDSVVAEQKAVTSSQPKSIAAKPKQLAANKSIETASSGSGIVAAPIVESEENQTALLDVSKSKEEMREISVEDKKAKEVVELEKAEKVSLAEPSAPSVKKDALGYASRSQESRKKNKVGGQEQVIQGQVISAEDGTPLPGVNVIVQGTTQGAVTDANGNYQLTAEDLTQKLVFSFVGFQTQEVAVANKQSLNVKLDPDLTQLSEVVVTGATPRDDDREPVIKLAEPAGGRKAYDKYLDNSMRYPVEALTNNIKGKVTIKFTVRTDGALDEFSVVKSIGHGCDEEVIRLVKEGPKWSPTTEDNLAVESEVLVKVRFDPAKAKR